MEITENFLFDGLKKQPYIQVPFPIPPRQLEEAVMSFFAFLELPNSLKNHIDLKIAPLHRRGEIGFRHRNAEDGPYGDNKDFFHFHPLILEKYDSFIKDNPIVKDFIMKAHPIWNATYHVVQELMKIFEKRFSGVYDKIFKTEEVYIILRFLKYDWVHSGKYLAKPHFDSGSFTLAIAESCPGLRIGSGPNDLKPVTHEDHHALFMVSSNFRKVADTDILTPGWHDVIQQNDTHIGKPFSRWAIVAFIEAANVEALSKAETHKWYQPT